MVFNCLKFISYYQKWNLKEVVKKYEKAGERDLIIEEPGERNGQDIECWLLWRRWIEDKEGTPCGSHQIGMLKGHAWKTSLPEEILIDYCSKEIVKLLLFWTINAKCINKKQWSYLLVYSGYKKQMERKSTYSQLKYKKSMKKLLEQVAYSLLRP